MPARLTREMIIAAIGGFEAQKARIDAQLAALRAMLGGNGAARVTLAVAQPTKRKRRKLSAAARKRISEGQRKRWAESRTRSAPRQPISTEPTRRGRRLSAAGRRTIIAATKRRWDAVRAAKETAGKSTARNKVA